MKMRRFLVIGAVIAFILSLLWLKLNSTKPNSKAPIPLTTLIPPGQEIAIMQAKTETLPKIEALSEEDTKILIGLIAENPLPVDIEPLTEEDTLLLVENEIIREEEAKDIVRLENLLKGKR